MNKIYEQISHLIDFTHCNSIDALNARDVELYQELKKRVKKMKSSGLFTSDEIKAVKRVCKDTLQQRYDSTRKILCNKLKSNYTF